MNPDWHVGKDSNLQPLVLETSALPIELSALNELIVTKLFEKKKGRIKQVLMDQNFISGIGNIYADESLWAARIHGEKPADTLSKPKARELLDAVRAILLKALEEGGTSFDEQYKNVNGQSGYFAVSLNAYGMTDSPCNRCGTPIKRESWMNRGSHFCPKCQRLKP